MSDQKCPTNSDECEPIDAWRRWLANMCVGSYGMGMWMLFSATLGLFVFELTAQHKIGAIIAGIAMAAGFFGTVCVAYFAPRFFAVPHRETDQRTVLNQFLRRFRSFVGDGDIIQGIARWIDPGWQNQNSARTPEKTGSGLLTAEVIHWAALFASIPVITAGFWYRYLVVACVLVLVNLVYNILPILLIRQTRRRLCKLRQRRGTFRNNAVDGGISAVGVNEHTS